MKEILFSLKFFKLSISLSFFFIFIFCLQTSFACTGSEIKDCQNKCIPSDWIGDTYCDNGAYQYKNYYGFLNCSSFNCDQGDCDCCLDGEAVSTAICANCSSNGYCG